MAIVNGNRVIMAMVIIEITSKMMKLTSCWPGMSRDTESCLNTRARCNELQLRVRKNIGTCAVPNSLGPDNPK